VRLFLRKGLAHRHARIFRAGPVGGGARAPGVSLCRWW
jgi:hypothetical protein